jgi:heat shock protein HtpX
MDLSHRTYLKPKERIINMLYEQIRKNRRKTIFLFVIVFLLYSILGIGLGYIQGARSSSTFLQAAIIIDLIATPVILLQLAFGKKLMLHSAGAKQITEQEMPVLYHIVEDLSMVAKIPMPEVYIVEDDSINAFASGLRIDHAAVSVTTGALTAFNRSELEGVIAHEITHIANRDVRNMTIVIALSSILSFFQDLFFWTNLGDNDSDDSGNILSILLVALVRGILFFLQMAISRSQEYSADAGAVNLTRNPQGLIDALTTIEEIDEPTHIKKAATATMYFGPVDTKEWFSTHPDTAKRINALRKL